MGVEHMRLRRTVLVSLAMAAMLTTFATPAAATSFSDVSTNHAYSEAIFNLAERNVINGYGDNTFGPERGVWRQQFAKMIVLALGLPVSEADESSFLDVTEGGPHTLYPDNFIAVAEKYGITKGMGGGRFSPYAYIPRIQVVTMIVRAMDRLYAGVLASPPAVYRGTWPNFSRVHSYNVKKAEYNGLLSGLPLSEIGPWQPMPRGEVAQVLWNMMQEVPRGSPPLPPKKVVRIGYVPWDEDVAVSFLWKRLLEGAGYRVELVLSDLAPVYSGLASGDIDLFLDGWLPITHADYLDEYGHSIEDLGEWYDNARLTWAVPTYMGLDSIADLRGNAHLFDASVLSIEPGAGLTRLSREVVKPGYDLDAYEILEGSTPVMLAELERGTSRREPIVVTLWHPHWAYAAFPIKDLEDPKGLLGEVERIHAFARSGFSRDFPTIAEWIRNFEMSDEALASLEKLIIRDYGRGEEERAVDEWLDDPANQSMVRDWNGDR